MDRGEHPMNTVTVGGILLDRQTATSDRFTADVAGWLDGPPVRSGLQAKAQQDGAWDGSGSRTERPLEVTGFVEEATPAAADAALRELTALRPQAVYEVVDDLPELGRDAGATGYRRQLAEASECERLVKDALDVALFARDWRQGQRADAVPDSGVDQEVRPDGRAGGPTSRHVCGRAG